MKINMEQYTQIINNFLVAARTGTAYQQMLCAKLDAIAESQGKLYAAQNEVSARIISLETEVAGDFAKLYNGHGLCLTKLGELLDAWKILVTTLAPPRPRTALARKQKLSSVCEKKNLPSRSRR